MSRGIALISYLGDPTFIYNNFLPIQPIGLILMPYDIVVLIVFSLAIFAWAYLSNAPECRLKMRSFLSVSGVSQVELESLLTKAGEFKRAIQAREDIGALKRRVVALLFEKPSTRTRTSFEVATARLGGQPLYLAADELQLSRIEPIKDTARILGGYLDAIVGRVYSHDTLVQLKEYAGIPAFNGLSDLERPTQIVSGLFSIREARGRLKGLNFAYIGDRDNVCNSLLLGSPMLGMNITVGCPSGYSPNPDILSRAEDTAKETGSSVRVVQDPKEAALLASDLEVDALLVLTDVEKVALDFGKPNEKKLDRLTVEECEKYPAVGQFPKGSMGPKIEAAVRFVKTGGQKAVISSLEHSSEALAGKAGTLVTQGL